MLNLNLGSSSGGGSYIRFSPAANAWSNQDGEITLKKVVFDIDNVETGWLLLAVGTRDWQPDAELGKKGAQPTPEHKRGFIVKFYNKEMGVVEWSSNGVGPNMGLNNLYQLCASERDANPGKLPVIEYKGSKAEKIGKGTTRIPNFEIAQWVARPEAMNADGSSSSAKAEDDFDPFPAPKAAAVAPTTRKAPVDDAEMFE
jgi:hypothetical protein